MKREKIYYILLKTHNETGLKYLCKHVSSFPNSVNNYNGSGVYWRRHLEKHGCDLTTQILAECHSPEEAAKIGMEYSNKWNVVESKEFANLIPENGQGGSEPVKYRKNHPGWRGLRFPGDSNPSKRPDVRKKISVALTGRIFSDEWRKKLSEAAVGRKSLNKGKTMNQGEKNGSSKLTEDQVRSIKNDQRSISQIAVDFSISWCTISDIKKGRTWKHV